MEMPINICKDAAETSNLYELNNGQLKKDYLIKNITLYNEIVKRINGSRGSFGTGYPFYALGPNLTGNLPIIDEQLRYNQELIDATNNSNRTMWTCGNCLSSNCTNMPDLKQICKPCPNMDDELKPRKVINRLPDIDLWMVCDPSKIDFAKEVLIHLFAENNFQPSDIDPLQTLSDITEITHDLYDGNMPTKLLPLDAHIIDSSIFESLIEKLPYTLKCAMSNQIIPYLPIHPLSYRKSWQYDDEAYNFVHDFLSSLTDYNFDNDLSKLLTDTRKEIANTYTFDQLYDMLIKTGPESVSRRHKTLQLKNSFRERIDLWKK